MDLLQDAIHKLFFRYFFAAFGSACISCIYGIVDMAVIGQYHGPAGTAAMAVVMPVFNIIYSLGLFVGIGGCVLYSIERGKSGSTEKDRNEYFTLACLYGSIFSIVVWIILFAFEDPLLVLFGADETLLPLSKQYMAAIRLAAPVFLGTQLFGAFLRNDNAPGLATASVLISGVFNIFGDFFFVFALDMGILGAGIATSIGGAISLAVMLTHFLSGNSTLHFTRIQSCMKKTVSLLAAGFSTFFTDFALGIITVLFNRQTMEYLGTGALAVFGILMNINTFVQCCGYSIGQAAQPIISTNFGAAMHGRIRETLKYAVLASAAFGVIWIFLIAGFPNAFVRLFMSPAKEVLTIAPGIMRTYSAAFLLVPFNVFCTYYFQSTMEPECAFIISIGRGLVISGVMILVLPAAFGADALWLAMPVTEAAVAACAVICAVIRMRGK